jgi:hypothetical protein
MIVETAGLKKAREFQETLKSDPKQGCQIFRDTMYQNGGKYTTLPQITK